MVRLILNGRGSPARRLLGKRIFPLGPFPGKKAQGAPQETGGSPRRVTLYYPQSDMDLKMTAAKLKFELRRDVALLPKAILDRDLARRLAAADFACLLRASYVTGEAPLLTLVEWFGGPLGPLPDAADDAALISRMIRLIDRDGRHLFLFHRPRRLAIAQDLVGVKTVMGIPVYEDAWHALP